MKDKKDSKKREIAAKAFQSLVSATDLSGQMQQQNELIKSLENQPAHESIIENKKAQMSMKELALSKMQATDSAVVQGEDLRKKENEITKTIKNKEMSTKKEILSQMKKNANEITSKSEILAKKMNDTKKEIAPSKKEILEKKFKENKPANPSKKEVLESKKQDFKNNKKDMLGDKGSDKKGSDKIKTEYKPDKPKLR